jgi:hypothetical protein
MQWFLFINFKLTLTLSIRIVSDCVTYSYQSTRKLKQAITHGFTRMSSVEQVFGPLIHFLGSRKDNTLGRSDACVSMQVAGHLAI